MADEEIILRHPEMADGNVIYNLVKSGPSLNLNSQYYYHMMCSDFGKSSLIAQRGEEVLGYVCGYVTPEDEKCLLITEIVVLEAARNKGLAGALLANLAQDWSGIITNMKTTIVASNTIAQALFNGFAEKNGYTVTTEDFIAAKAFGKDEKHETEVMYTIKVK